MRQRASKFIRVEYAAPAGAFALMLAAAAFAAEYQMTVNRDRLVNAQNEPQNWLLMNGDYGATRYSKLTQFNRDNVKNLRLVWAIALGGMQDVGQNGPENEVNPLIDNGFMYTTDGWGTVYKIDARNPNKGEFVWVADPGVKHQGNVPRTRGIALWEDLVIANLPDGRVIAINRQRRDRVGQDGRRQDRVRQAGPAVARLAISLLQEKPHALCDVGGVGDLRLRGRSHQHPGNEQEFHCNPPPAQNPYSFAGLSTRIFLRSPASGAHAGRRFSTRPSSTWKSGVSSFGLRPEPEFGCGQFVPQRMRSGFAAISARASGKKGA